MYNKPFTLKELKAALKKCNDTAAGSDDIHYQLPKYLSFRSLSCLLDWMANHCLRLYDNFDVCVVLFVSK